MEEEEEAEEAGGEWEEEREGVLADVAYLLGMFQ